jgi:hypothetical protein
MGFITGESMLKDAVRAERQKFRAPVTEQYKVFLQGRATDGDDLALAELRRMSTASPGRPRPDVGSIGPASGQTEANGIFYRGREVRHLVHRNGDVVYSLAGRAIIQDKGNKLLMLQTDRMAIETALRLANAKFGGVLTLSGPKDFQERAAQIAAEAGIKVTFQDRKLEAIRQLRASELASERAKREVHRDLGRKFVEGQRRTAPTVPEGRKADERPAPSKDKTDKGPER